MSPTSRGFTAIELLMTMLAGSILALTAGLMLLISYRTWVANNSYMELQQQVSLTQAVADRWIREAAYWEVSATNGELLVFSDGQTRRLAQEGADLVYDPNISVSGDEIIIGSNTVDRFLINAAPLGVKLDLWLEQNDTKAEMHTFLSYRN